MIQGNVGGLEPAAMARLEMARADWFARSIGDFITKIDRSSGRDHERLVSLLINHEMALRSAREALDGVTPGEPERGMIELSRTPR